MASTIESMRRAGGPPPVAAGIAIVLLLGGCAAVAWPAGSLLVPRHGGHPVGSKDWSWAFLGCLIGAFVVYLLAVLAAVRGLVSLRTAFVLAVGIQLLPLAAPLLLSTDAWTYWNYGRLAAVHGANPYLDVPARFPLDVAYAHSGTDWHDTSSVYGPAFTLCSELLALVSGGSAAAAAWLYKSLAALALLAAAGLAARLSPRPALAVVLVGWSPLLAIHAAGAGHNDAWLAALMLGGLAAAAARRPLLAGAAWTLAVFVKWIPLILLPLRLLATRGESPSGKRTLAGALAVAVPIVSVAFWRYGWDWLGAFGPLARNADRETHFSVPHRLEELGLPHRLAIGLPLGVLALAAVPLLRGALRGRARLGLAAVLLIVCSPLLVPWYLLWALPLAAADDDDLAIVLGLATSAYVLRQSLPL